jgi:hypothetical protein
MNFNNILDPKTPHKKHYRGWAIGFSHYVGNEEQINQAVGMLDWYKENESKLWGGLFRDVAKYGQQRDTAKLVVDEKSANRIAFTLTDQMDDRYFDYPLTVKVRIPDAWQNPLALQQDKEVPVTVVDYNGAKYLLVKAVPDRGQVVLSSR